MAGLRDSAAGENPTALRQAQGTSGALGPGKVPVPGPAVSGAAAEAVPAPSGPAPPKGYGEEDITPGGGPAPSFMRWLVYGVYLAGALYLLVFWPDAGYSPVVLAAALAMLGWLAYIFIGKKPAEP